MSINKFIFNTIELFNALDKTRGVIQSRTPLPIIQDFKFNFNSSNRRCVITATNLTTTIQTKVFFDNADQNTQEEVDFCISAHMLYNTIKEIKNEDIVSFEYHKEKGKCIISTNNGNYTIKTKDAKEFPVTFTYNAEDFDNNDRIVFNTLDFYSAIDFSQSFCSVDEFKPNMRGIFIDNNALVATDAHALAKYHINNNDDKQITEIINTEALQLLKPIIANRNDEFYIIKQTNEIIFEYDDFVIITKKINEKFPDYKNIIPDLNKYSVFCLSTSLLTNAVKRVGLYVDKSNSGRVIELKTNYDKILIKADDNPNGNNAEEYVDCISDHEEEINIGFNCNQLLKVLSKIKSNDLLLYLDTPSRAAFFKDNENANFILLMPVLLRSNF